MSLRIVLLLFALQLGACSDDSTDKSSVPQTNQTSDTGPGGSGLDAANHPDGGTPIRPDATSGSDSVDPDTTGVQPDAERGDADDASHEDAIEACQPSVTACSADQCGAIDDGCGNSIQCQPCPCADGNVVIEGCGVCGLGVRTCVAGRSGFGTCEHEPTLPGIDAGADAQTCAAGLIFVDAGAPTNGDGSRTTPFNTYASAIAAAHAGQLIILGGDTTFTEVLALKDGVSVLGGFSSAPQFQWNESKHTKFRPAAPSNAAPIGVQAHNIHQDTLLTQVDVETANAPPGQNNYAAYVRDSDALTLQAVRILAGNAGAGANGADGARGARGEAGGHAGSQRVPNIVPIGTPLCISAAAGGQNSSCPTARGGNGGAGWCRSTGILQPDIEPKPGESTPGADGGRAGGAYKTLQNTPAGPTFITNYNGEKGESAPAVTGAGSNGVGGSFNADIVDGHWIPSGAGTDGRAGKDGGGGGGGGGAAKDPDKGISSASPGAGGGAGGCGGEGGKGGQPGASSFGLFLVNSQVHLSNARVEAGRGGNGGNGGSGGSGGLGASGGDGSNRAWTSGNPGSYGTQAWSSGKGGDGADGTRGGHGGAGAGGGSFGAYCVNSMLSQAAGSQLLKGIAGAGGTSPGDSGAPGDAADSENCIAP